MERNDKINVVDWLKCTKSTLETLLKLSQGRHGLSSVADD